jgi:hypothetical protein
MEYWSVGALGSTHHSIIPTLHHSSFNDKELFAYATTV